MPCSTEEALARLFYNTSSSVYLLLLFLYVSSIVLAKFFYFVGSNPIFPRNQNGYENYLFSDEEEEEEEELEERHSFHVHGHQYYTENDHLVADIIHGGEALKFLPNDNLQKDRSSFSDQEFISAGGSLIEEDQNDMSQGSESEQDHIAEEIPVRDTASVCNSVPNDQVWTTSPITIELHRSELRRNDKRCDDHNHEDSDQITENNTETKLSGDENFLVFRPPQSETKKLIKVQENKEDEIFGDSTVGSTSKSSSEWRSSINCSATEDPFSSSSRRSCPKWESYTVFQKYDEEMMYLDRISAQKLHETESLRSIQVCPRSISERIVHRISLATKRPSDVRHNPYHELEAAYVAQICITWEALNWNYKKFEQKRASSHHDFDPGCPGQIAQQFQQFQVLLQRYVENEPYEQGRRPEIYARMRLLAPKLLQVPEYRASEDDDHEKEEGFGSRISSAAFLMIMEDGIRTFMEFLKADKEKPCQKLSAMFRRKRRGSVDPTLLNLMKKVNQKKKMKIKDLRRSHKCLRKKSLKVEEEMEILLGLIDLKLVSRVLRMGDLSAEQLHWCEEKMSKVLVLDGKYHRDSTPLFFPAQ
ncbi:putative ribosomal protein L34Ae [Rosa chinensis]|uniref:Putative ribosomal protein L34Ae n=1 Tax=Rosa chinensis TaxID=74649 RepID=A0A2P6P3R1_ROSCH|nr:uncharacterized protein LOC112175378 isoform X1 [Rosa chinensis]PRQ16552.1 putative ribosomal protein L34Ae [Rosa chinensis]